MDIETNWQGVPASSYEDIVFDQALLNSLVNESPLSLVSYGVPMLMEDLNAFIISPPGSGKGPVLFISISNQVNLSLNSPQFLLVNHQAYLARETLEGLNAWCPSVKATNFEGGLKKNLKKLKNSHVVITEARKAPELLESAQFKNLKAVSFIGGNPCLQALKKSLELLLMTIQCKIWIFDAEKRKNSEWFLARTNREFNFLVLKNCNEFLRITHHLKIFAADKLKVLLDLIKTQPPKIVFCKQNSTVEEIAELLSWHFPVCQVTKDTPEHKFRYFLKLFKNKRVKVLVCFAWKYFIRNIKRSECLEVINFEVPTSIGDYHRVTRRDGFVSGDTIINLVSNEQEEKRIERLLKQVNIEFSA